MLWTEQTILIVVVVVVRIVAVIIISMANIIVCSIIEMALLLPFIIIFKIFIIVVEFGIAVLMIWFMILIWCKITPTIPNTIRWTTANTIYIQFSQCFWYKIAFWTASSLITSVKWFEIWGFLLIFEQKKMTIFAKQKQRIGFVGIVVVCAFEFAYLYWRVSTNPFKISAHCWW